MKTTAIDDLGFLSASPEDSLIHTAERIKVLLGVVTVRTYEAVDRVPMFSQFIAIDDPVFCLSFDAAFTTLLWPLLCYASK